MNTQPILKAFYNDTAIENWVCINIVEYYHAKSGQKNLIKIMDHIKKDLQKVADDDSEFEMMCKRKAQEILNDWKYKLRLLVFSDEFLVRRLVQTGTLVYTEEKPKAFQWREYWEFASKKDQADDHKELQKTPEHKIYSDLFVPPTTKSESDDKETDSDDFSLDKRNPKNFTFDEFVDRNDEYVDDDQESLFLDEFFFDDSVALDENDDGNPV
ncbi:26566_t:CDS:2, partial [Racocetra persica]